MKIKILVVGKTEEKYLKEGCLLYLNKLSHYIDVEYVEIPELKDTKGLSIKEQKNKEGALVLNKIEAGEKIILLDEKGATYTSIQFSEFLQKQMNQSLKKMVFVMGGPYGFSEEIYEKASFLISLSSMTFSHQMVRLFFLEQLYRAFTILHKEPYHHK